MGQVNAPQLVTPMGYDLSSQLWLPLKMRPVQTDPVNGEEYAAMITSGDNFEVPFSTTTVQPVAMTDVQYYRWVEVHITGQGTGSTVTFQVSNDGITFVNAVLLSSSNLTGSGIAVSATTAGIWHGPISARYFRLNVTGISAGTTAGIIEFHSLPSALHAYSVSANQSGAPWFVAGPNANGVQTANSAANTIIKATSGWLFHAIVTTLGTAALTVYDNASTNAGTPLLVIPASAAVGTIYSFPSGARATNGIVSAGVLNCPGVTFHYF